VGGRRDKPKVAPPPPEPPELQALADAVKGLTYPSETDSPFDVFTDDRAATAEDVVAKRGAAKPETVSPDQFFGELEDTDDAQRFRQLRLVIEKNLSGVTVLRSGSRKVDVYLIGRTRGGTWAGIHTTSVET
jgi:hypothetical protein